MWFFYAISGAFFKSLAGYYRKVSTKVPASIFVWLNSLFYVALLLPIVLLIQLPVVDFMTKHSILALGLALTASGGLILNVKALSKDELSFVAPLNGLIPVMGLLGAWMFADELPSYLGILCVGLIFVGAYIMALTPNKVRWYDPILYLFKSSAARLSFGVAILYSLNTVLSKLSLNLGYDPITILFITDFISILLLSYVLFTNKRKLIMPALVSDWKTILASSISSLLGSILHIFAVAGTYVSYALAIRRFDTIFSVVLGWKLLKESNIRNKLIGVCFIVLGSILLALIS